MHKNYANDKNKILPRTVAKEMRYSDAQALLATERFFFPSYFPSFSFFSTRDWTWGS